MNGVDDAYLAGGGVGAGGIANCASSTVTLFLISV